MGDFFICFVTFTSTLVYSVIYNQSIGLYEDVDIYDWNEVVFLYYILSFTYMVNEDAGDMHSLDHS